MKRARKTTGLGSLVINGIKIALIACILTAVLVLLLAISMKWEWIGIDGVDAVNTCIKAISACFAGVLASRLHLKRNWICAGVIGMLYMALSLAIFAILNGGFRVSVRNVSDVLMAFACASCSCIAAGILHEQFEQKRTAEKQQRPQRAG